MYQNYYQLYLLFSVNATSILFILSDTNFSFVASNVITFNFDLKVLIRVLCQLPSTAGTQGTNCQTTCLYYNFK